MKNKAFLYVAFISVAICGAMSGGCRLLTNRGIARDHVAWALAENRTVRFVAETEVNDTVFRSRRVRDELCLQIVSDRRVVRQWTIARWEDGPRPKSAGISLAHLEARADASRQRIWVVDTNGKRVVASVDLRTGGTTGIEDAAPRWAKLAGGTVLKKAPTLPLTTGFG